MAASPLKPISKVEQRKRLLRVRRIAKGLSFTGLVEYRHVMTFSGGAQYQPGSGPDTDLLTVYPKAFERDSDSDDFSLEAIIAHERGHQILARHPRIARFVRGFISLGSEEILASILGAIISEGVTEREALIGKAAAELLSRGASPEATYRQIWNLFEILEGML